mmetsp:Transcript_83642/g.135626  ORF Transcript_83642/g.135626 Transcript_83642/m.135626 type:complete len:91 (-) Transcript_83642:567-839(-)
MFMWMNMDEYAGKGESCLDSISKHKLWCCWRWFLEQRETQEQMEQEEHQEQQEQLLRGLCPFSLAHSRNPCCISAGGSVVFQQEALFVAA